MLPKIQSLFLTSWSFLCVYKHWLELRILDDIFVQEPTRVLGLQSIILGVLKGGLGQKATNTWQGKSIKKWLWCHILDRLPFTAQTFWNFGWFEMYVGGGSSVGNILILQDSYRALNVNHEPILLASDGCNTEKEYVLLNCSTSEKIRRQESR